MERELLLVCAVETRAWQREKCLLLAKSSGAPFSTSLAARAWPALAVILRKTSVSTL